MWRRVPSFQTVKQGRFKSESSIVAGTDTQEFHIDKPQLVQVTPLTEIETRKLIELNQNK